MIPVLVDTGVIVSAFDRRQLYHKQCKRAIDAIVGPLVTCESVISESIHLLRRVSGAAEAILDNVSAGAFEVPFRLDQSTPAILSIFRKYRDRQVDLADACLIHLANELKTGDILTLDNDFAVYRWGANRPFRNLVSLTRPI